ncbi:hypothetical protein ACFYOA_09815 [Streptomyces iakyrus]|uniref:hypothetical protein n=1 Tax=Streptomyces iakyrus TaxID=68219 RepID=UPI00368D1928
MQATRSRTLKRDGEVLRRLHGPAGAATGDIEVGGAPVTAGAKVMIMLGAAVRAPRRHTPIPGAGACGVSASDRRPSGAALHHRVGTLPTKAGARLVLTGLPCGHRGIRPARENLVRRPRVNIREVGELRGDPAA